MSSDTPVRGAELEELRARLNEAEQTLRALRMGEADAVVVDDPEGTRVYTLKDAAEPYRLLVEQMGQSALTASRDGLILFCNDTFAQLLGRPRERLVATRLQDHAAPGTQERLAELLRRGHYPGREITFRARDGENVEVYVTSTPLSIEGEDVRCLVLTDLSQQELRLRHDAVVRASQDAIYTVDPQLVIQTWNAGAEALTGLAAKEAIGRSEWDLCPPEHRAELEQLMHQVKQEVAAGSIDTVRRRPDGSRVDLIYSLTPLKDRCGRVTGYSIVAHDITERKEAEQRLRFLTAELDHRSKNLLATVQAIASLSAESTSSLDIFLNAFKARIMALANAHRLLSRQGWRGAAIRDIVGAALAGFDGDRRIQITGCAADLKPYAAHDLALSLHELTTNAAKYGALSVPHGSIELGWWRKDGPLVIDWREVDGPPVSPPARQGLGWHVIQNIAGAYGRVDYRFKACGVQCRFELSPDCLLN